MRLSRRREKEILALRGGASVPTLRGGTGERKRKRKEAMRSMRWLMCDGAGGAEKQGSGM